MTNRSFTSFSMFRCLAPAVCVLAAIGTRGAPSDRTVATYSIVAYDAKTGDLGVAVQSKFFGVGSVVPFAKAGVGAVATQSRANTHYGPEGLALLRRGFSAKGAVSQLTRADELRDVRQLGIVDANGEAAAFTGDSCQPFAGHIVGERFSVLGNLLAGEDVVRGMARVFTLARNAGEGELADWLMAALEAAEKAGGDRRGRQSAALLVVREKGGYDPGDGRGNDRYIDLRVEDDPEPIEELARLLELHKRFYAREHARRPTPASIDREMRKAPTESDFQRWGWPVFLLAFAGIAFIFVGSNKVPPAPALGVRGGLLTPPPNRANTVSSQLLESERRVSPFSMPNGLEDARVVIGEAVMKLPRTKLVSETDDYLRYECSTALMRFVDDLELYFNEKEKLVHIRSGSRVGFWDLGVNRRRVEQLRELLPEDYRGPGRTKPKAHPEPVTSTDDSMSN